jgi:DNA-binding PadR family transcriptional regulator
MLVESYKESNVKMYKLTPDGRKGLQEARNFFIQEYGDIAIESM